MRAFCWRGDAGQHAGKEEVRRRGRALERAGYKVKLAKRLSFSKLAPLADRVADFEEIWLDPEVDLVLCARGGTGAQDVITKLNWEKLRTRPDQRVLGFSNITMILNAMLREKAGHPFSGSSISHLNYAKGDTCEWLARAITAKPHPTAQLRALKPGAFEGLPCGGHIALVKLGIAMKWNADMTGRVVFLERNNSTNAAGISRELDAILASGALNAVRAPCPVYDGYAYGHIPVSHAIDFRRVVRVSTTGEMSWE